MFTSRSPRGMHVFKSQQKEVLQEEGLDDDNEEDNDNDDANNESNDDAI